jgi:hypothetical protein
MKSRGKLARAFSISVLIVALLIAGCQESGVGMIDADRGTVEKLIRTNSDKPPKPASKRPSLDDVSPRSRGTEAQP